MQCDSIISRALLRCALLAWLAVFAACDRQANAPITGMLYCGSGEYIMQISLDSGHVEPLKGLGDVRVRGLQSMADDELLVLTEKLMNNRPVYRIGRFDTRRYDLNTVVEGSSAVFLTAPQHIVFDSGTQVRLVSTRAGEPDPGITVFTHPFNRNVLMLPVGDSSLLYQIERNGTREVYRYVSEEHRFTAEPALSSACHLQDAVWLATDELLACRADTATASPYRLVHLDGRETRTLSIPGTAPMRAVAYAEQAQSLVLTGAGRPEDEAGIWAFHLPSNALTQISSGANLSGSCVHRDLQAAG